MGIHTNCYILLHNKRCIIVKNAVNCSIIKGDLSMEVLLLVNLCWLGVGLYTYLTLEN